MKKSHHNKAGLAKLSPPRLTNILLRERLFEKLEQLKDYPVIWISASGGAGKTVLAASFLQQQSGNSIWYQIDEGDQDPAAFLEYLGMALDQYGAEKANALPVFSAQYQKSIEAYSRNFSRQLYLQLGENGYLVLDNFQDLPAEAETHKALKQFFSEIPQYFNIIVLSRTEPSADYLRFRANGTLAVLDGQDIALNADETEEICLSRLDNPDKKERKQLAADIHRFTQGWAAGLVLMLEQSGDVNIPSRLAGQKNNSLVFDYFAGEIFQNEIDETKTFLMKTAFLPFFTIAVAEQLTRNPEAESILQNLIQRNYFTYRSALVADAYEYHPLFREFLLSRVETFFNVRDLRKIQIHAGELLDEGGWYAEAANLYCQAKAWERMAKLIRRQGYHLMQMGRHALLHGWLQCFPMEFFEKEPWMEYWLAMSLQPMNTRDSRNHFERVYEKFTRKGDRCGQLNAWSGLIETYIHDLASFIELDHWISVLEQLLSDGEPLPDEALNARVSMAMFTALMYRQPYHERMEYWEGKVREVIFNTPDVTKRLDLGSQLLLYYTVWTGDLPKAAVLLQVLRQSMQPEKMNPLSLILWYATEATYFWKTGDPAASIQWVKKGMEVANTYDVHAYDVLLLASGIYASCAQNKLDQAAGYRQKMEASLNRSRLVDVVHYHYLAAGLAIVNGELGMAREYAETALEAAHHSGALYPETLSRLILALCLIRQGKLTEVVFHLNRIRDLAEKINSRSLSYLNRLVASEAAFSCGETEQGLVFLKQAVEHERDLGRVHHGFWWDRSLAENCIQALSQNKEVKFIQQLIRNNELIPGKAPLHLDNWEWPIRIYTLGRFSIARYGEPLSFTPKSSKRPLELLKVLIAHGGRQVSQETLIETLWPDSEGDAAAQSLYTTTHRLRKLVSEHGIVMQEGRLSIDARYIWVDSLAFLRIAGRLQDCLMMSEQAGQTDLAEIEKLGAQFYQLYKGGFMGQGEPRATYVPMQERLHLRFLKLTEMLGHYWQQRGDLDKSIACFEGALEIDPVAEEFYQALMQSYQQSGRAADAVSLYQRCRKNLSSRLGVSPSKATVDIYQGIKK